MWGFMRNKNRDLAGNIDEIEATLCQNSIVKIFRNIGVTYRFNAKFDAECIGTVYFIYRMIAHAVYSTFGELFETDFPPNLGLLF
jgi:hypothetical protein